MMTMNLSLTWKTSSTSCLGSFYLILAETDISILEWEENQAELLSFSATEEKTGLIKNSLCVK